ncbi:MAG: DUF4382 domain-containing protein [Planctomycetota bacterium]|jgi:hypothetical protein
MSSPLPRHCLPLLALLLAVAVFGPIGCGGGPESPTAPAASAVGGGGGTGNGGTGDGGGGSGGGGGTPPTTPGSSLGSLTIHLTDKPIDEVSELNVFIGELKVKRDGAPVERFASTLGLVDLLALQGGVTELLGQGEVEAGTYQFIEILLDEDQSYAVDLVTGDELALKIPSEKIKIKGGPFDVAAAGATSVLIDFDAERSLKKTGNGRYQLKPFVSIVQVTQSSG